MFNSLNNSAVNSGQTLTGTKKLTATPSKNPSVNQSSPQGPYGNARDSSTVSTLASQLSEASVHAQARDVRLTKMELSSMAKNTFNELESANYTANKSKYDSEVPDSDNPILLARAKSSTQYTNGLGKNPFSGMPMDQLALITYDDSGTFTVNERRAALEESAKQEFAWRQKVVAEAEFEYNSTGKLTNFFQSVLDHYKGLPPVEQAQYPNNYETKLNDWIDLDFNYFTNIAEGKKKMDTERFASKILDGDSSLFDDTTSSKEAAST
ncbi:hypothetical protein PS726_02147 [Pseudomonas fluorescens]|uniref:hypothetical protein n=1 Tax=Pseudomonas fluorescens TaxID=294 RepID=UPI001259C162|nr:hypothetical protein [Pseudomonas fluorescens]VVN94517.1 hypothetical protein PS726_02147 [Pseudomonas fluorescens]